MPEFTTSIAMDVRAYGSVTVEAETEQQAKQKLTAEYVADNFIPHGSGSDDFDMNHPLEIWAEGFNDESGCFDVKNGDWGMPDKTTGAIIQAARDLLEQVEQMRDLFDDDDHEIKAAADAMEQALEGIA